MGKPFVFGKKIHLHSLKGYWGEPSSSVDWCEPNYQHVPFIAETFNTITNGFYILLALIGIFNILSNLKIRTRHRHLLSYFSLLIIGIGSTYFHGTLTKIGQLFDEVPMLWILCFIYFSLDCMDDKKTSLLRKVVVSLVMIFIGVGVLFFMYLYPENPFIFFTTFILLCWVTISRQLSLQLSRENEPKWRVFYIFCCLSLFFCGMIVWATENAFCDHSLFDDCSTNKK